MSKISIFTLLLLVSSSINASSQYDVKKFCQDLNVILLKVKVHASNISNHKTTRTPEGGEYKRQVVTSCQAGHCDVIKEDLAPALKYMPNHPDSNESGYVAFPGYSIHDELASLMRAHNAYDLVVQNMPIKSIDFLAGTKLDQCFQNYSFFKEQFDFRDYLGRK